jgi:hypothetical protein
MDANQISHMAVLIPYYKKSPASPSLPYCPPTPIRRPGGCHRAKALPEAKGAGHAEDQEIRQGSWHERAHACDAGAGGWLIE